MYPVDTVAEAVPKVLHRCPVNTPGFVLYVAVNESKYPFCPMAPYGAEEPPNPCPLGTQALMVTSRQIFDTVPHPAGRSARPPNLRFVKSTLYWEPLSSAQSPVSDE